MTTQDLADRLTRLERENRRLKRIGAVVLIGIAAVVVMGQAKRPEVHDVLAAKQFILKDRDGNDRAMLYMSHSTARLGLFDEEERSVVTLTADKDGSGGFGLSGRVSLRYDERGTSLLLHGKSEGSGFSALVDVTPERASYELRNGAGKRQAAIELCEDLPDQIFLLDKKGEDIFRVPK